MAKKKTPKRKFIAYILYKDSDFGYKMKKIAKFLDVSQSTISNWVKEVKYEVEIHGLKKELKKAKKFLESTCSLPDYSGDIIDVD